MRLLYRIRAAICAKCLYYNAMNLIKFLYGPNAFLVENICIG